MAKIRIGVIPAAGQGRRIGYLSSFLPKPLLPIYDKPIIHYAIKNMEKLNVEEIFIPVCYHKKLFEKYFSKIENSIGSKINLITLRSPTKGIADTIYKTKNFIQEPFITILGDDFTVTPSLQNLVDSFFKNNSIVVEGIIEEPNKEILSSTCSVKINKSKQIIEIIEKPKNPTSKYRGTGIYIFDAKIFGYIEKTPISPPRNEVEITNTIALVAKEGKAYGEFINGINININTMEDLFHAWSIMKNLT
jgi:dTDP-glucose pyrophosphorylase